MKQIDAGRLVLRVIRQEEARILLAGRTPPGMVFAPGYPSQFSLEVMELVLRAQEPGGFGPFFMIHKAGGAVIGEIGCGLDDASATGQVGYSVVEPSWGHGYATEALRALLNHVFAQQGVRRVVAETMVEHTASRRVMEKAGMRYCGQRVGIEDGQSVNLVVYEALAGSTDLDAAGGDLPRPSGLHEAEPR